MNTQPDFTPQQIEFLTSAIFDTLGNHFNYPLGEKKRKAVMAKAFNARNYDALLQRLSRNVIDKLGPDTLYANSPVILSKYDMQKRGWLDFIEGAPVGAEPVGNSRDLIIRMSSPVFEYLTQDHMPMYLREAAHTAVRRSVTNILICEDSPHLRNDDFSVSLANLRPAERKWLTNHPVFQHGVSMGQHETAVLSTGMIDVIKSAIKADPVRFASIDMMISKFEELGANRIALFNSTSIVYDNELVDFTQELHNENCLAGMLCPRCGSEGPFAIESNCTMEWEDDGSDDDSDSDSPEFSDNAECICKECGLNRKIEAFKIQHGE